jgi:hypothetical protein
MQNYPILHSDDPDCAEAADQLQLVSAHDCPPQPLQWLWPERIPLGKVTLLIGDPGTGKSLLALDIAARASRGGPWPEIKGECGGRKAEGIPADCLSPSTLPLPPSSTILLSASDDLADTIRPRLDAAGADTRRVFIIPSIADLRNDFKQLRAAVNRAPNCRLIVIDPINAYVGPSDSHFQTVVRKVLAPLARLAAEKHIAVLAIAHLRKSEGEAIYRAAGSMGFVAAARAVWSLTRDPENEQRHRLLPIKNNVGPAACGLAFTIQPTGRLAAPAIVWDAEPLAADAARKSPVRPSPERVEARDWLRQALAGGPRPAVDVIEDGQQHGFLRRTLQRAFHELEGHSAKRGLHQGWWWSLTDRIMGGCERGSAEGSNGLPPSTFPPPPCEGTPKTADIFEDVTFQHDVAAQQYVDSLLAARPPLSHSIAAIERLDRQRRAENNAQASRTRPAKTGHPVLDSILDQVRSMSPAIGQPSPDTS